MRFSTPLNHNASMEFKTRALSCDCCFRGSVMRAVLFYVVLMLMGPYAVYSDGAIRQDFSLKAETLVPAFMETSDRKCTSTLGVFHQCSFNFLLNDAEQSQNYNMFAFGSPDTIVLLRGIETGRLTSTTGQEYLWNRVITMAVLLCMSFLTLIGILKYFTTNSTSSASNNRAAPNPAYANQTAKRSQHANTNRQRSNKGGSFGTRSHS